MTILDQYMAAKQRVLLVGPPGCAKTKRIEAAAKAAGYELIIMRASLSERVDFGGALVPDTDAGVTKALPLELLDELQKSLGLTYLFVSHDLAVVQQISDTVSVMHKGRQVDGGPVDAVFAQPDSDYTRELIDAIPGRKAPLLAMSTT